MKPAVLVVEDDENLRLGLTDNLGDEGYRVVAAATSEAARASIAKDRFELIVLDVMLPDGNGYELCRELRAAGNGAMVLMLTARTLEEDVVRGLEAGADDYLAKPYRLAELLARVKALLRRGAARAPGGDALEFAGYRLDRKARTVSAPGGAAVDLTRTEFDLLALFVSRRGEALPRQRILDEVWGQDVVVDGRTIDNFVSSLKRKLGWTGKSRFAIVTVRGVGYRMEIT